MDGLQVFDEGGDVAVHGTAEDARVALVVQVRVEVARQAVAEAARAAQAARVRPVRRLHRPNRTGPRAVTWWTQHIELRLEQQVRLWLYQPSNTSINGPESIK